MDPEAGIGQAISEEEFGRLYDAAQRELRTGDRQLAAEAIEHLVARAPDSTSAHELMGDLLMAQGKRKAARDSYKRAVDLEPSNADAERKYAEAALALGSVERTRQLMESGDFDELRGATVKNSGAAAARSLFFPGLGQLYNGEYEKGIIAAAAGLPLFGLALWGLVNFVMSALPRSAGSMSFAQHLLALLGIIGYGALVSWSVWDAWRAGVSEQSAPAGHQRTR